MPFNESPDTPIIDWLRVKVIITSLYIISHILYKMDVVLHALKTPLFPWPICSFPSGSSNNKQGQTKNTECWWHPRKVQHLWHSLIGSSLMELPIESHSIRIELATLMSLDAIADKATDNHWAPVTSNIQMKTNVMCILPWCYMDTLSTVKCHTF